VEPTKDRKLSAKDRDENAAKWDTVDEALFNPEIIDSIGLVETIIRRESGNMLALGKQISQWIPLAKKTGQIPSSNSSKTNKTESTPTE
jgi:hypothetical protein